MSTQITMVNLLTGFIKSKLSEKNVLKKGFLESFINEENFTSRMIPTYIIDSIYEDDCMDCLKLLNFKKIIEYNIINNPNEAESFMYIFIKNVINEINLNRVHKNYDNYIELVDLLINGNILPESIIYNIIHKLEQYYDKLDYSHSFFYVNKDIYIIFKNYIDINKINNKICLLDKAILNKDFALVEILIEDGVNIHNEKSIINQPFSAITKYETYYNDYYKKILNILIPDKYEQHNERLNYSLINNVDEDNIEEVEITLINMNKSGKIINKNLLGDFNIPIIGFARSINMVNILLPHFSIEDKYGRIVNNIDDLNIIKYLIYQGFQPYNGIIKMQEVYNFNKSDKLLQKISDVKTLHKKYKKDLINWTSSSKNNKLCKYVWSHIISFL